MKALTLVLLAALLGTICCADKEEWRKRSIYQLLTDRFARNDGQQYGCDNLGTDRPMQATTAAVAIGAS